MAQVEHVHPLPEPVGDLLDRADQHGLARLGLVQRRCKGERGSGMEVLEPPVLTQELHELVVPRSG